MLHARVYRPENSLPKKSKLMLTESQRYRLQMKATSKMLREYFSGVSIENLRRRYGYSEKKIRELASS